LSQIIEQGFNPLSFRYLCLGTHYRKPLNFSFDALEAAEQSLKRIGRAAHHKDAGVADKDYLEKFTQAINDDLDTPKVLSILHEIIKDASLPDSIKAATVLKIDEFLAVVPEETKSAKIPSEVIDLANKRQAMRGEKRWAEADQLRTEIEAKGFTINDNDSGFLLTPL
jgi:cysteinyl-tRNA synthetase